MSDPEHTQPLLRLQGIHSPVPGSQLAENVLFILARLSFVRVKPSCFPPFLQRDVPCSSKRGNSVDWDLSRVGTQTQPAELPCKRMRLSCHWAAKQKTNSRTGIHGVLVRVAVFSAFAEQGEATNGHAWKR